MSLAQHGSSQIEFSAALPKIPSFSVIGQELARFFSYFCPAMPTDRRSANFSSVLQLQRHANPVPRLQYRFDMEVVPAQQVVEFNGVFDRDREKRIAGTDDVG